jgi:MFS family permease
MDFSHLSSRPQPPLAFFQLWLPSLLVFTVGTLAMLGLNWYISQSPGGTRLLGLTVALANIVATVAVVALAGVIDRSRKVTFLLCAKVGLALALLGLLLGILLGGMEAAPAALVLALASVVAAYVMLEAAQDAYFAGVETSLADLAPTHWPPSRTATLMQVQRPLARLAAPVVAGPLLAGWLWMLPLVGLLGLGLAAGMTWVIAKKIPTLQVVPPPSPSSKGSLGFLATALEDAKGSIGWIRSRAELVFLLIVSVLTNFIVFPLYALLPAFVTELGLENPALVYSQSAAAYGAGMLLGTVAMLSLRRRWVRASGVVVITVLVLCGLVASLAWYPTTATLVWGMGALGCGFMVLVAVVGGVWLERTPAEMRVRVFSLRRLVGFASIPLSTSLLGLAGAAWGLVPVLKVLSVAVAGLLVVSWYLLGRRV